ncbi:hypothetical protein F2Q68_00034112 [Brassica cretica]|uniref:Uncharacterized protein n=1 Tax=Brassica cretica TaxID=69181 RepID=A0A8S9HAN6_BRACR|nr:hypothetical protein F2Q68_00034112 [Brassica cretica]
MISFSNRRPGVRHSTFESPLLGRSSQSIASGFLRFWDSLNFKKDREFVGITVLFLDEKVNFVIHGFTPVRRANHYMPSLKEGSIVKVDHFEVASFSNRRPGVRHSTFESLLLGRSSQSIASGFLRFWDSLNFKKDKEFVGITVLILDEKVNFVIHGFTPVRRANHYMPSLKEGSIVKVDHFEVARCSSMYTIIDHPFLIHFISLTIIDEVITVLMRSISSQD